MSISNLQPQAVWKFFDEITQIPHPSKKEERIVQYLLDFAQARNLAFEKDDANNVLIKKKATSGKEQLPTIVLQSHVDMVCEKNKETVFDFEKDAIQTYIDGDWVKTRGTTLGADNGIGVAAQLAILDANNLVHGNIECLFTTEEEVGLNGASALRPGFISGNILINLDTEEEGEFCIGCAGGKNVLGAFAYKEEKTPADYFWFNVEVKKLKGGHSGCEIHKGLGNSVKILARYLWTLAQQTPVSIARIDGGNLSNAIPREAYATVGIPFHEKEKAIICLNTLQAEVAEELKNVDVEVSTALESTDAPQYCIDSITANKLINTLHACPHGVIGMSFDIPGLVETSTNLASVKMSDNHTVLVTTSQRSSSNSLRYNISNTLTALFSLAGASVTLSEGYPGWKPNLDSNILKVSEEVYEKLFGQKPLIRAIHAGLECGLFLEKYPALDMISCGPTILGAHSPEERVQISTVEKWWKFLTELIRQIPAK
jgi:dipeptidase D